MAKKNAALLFGFCFALAACADSATNRGITAPAAQPSLDVTAALADAFTPLGSDESVALAEDVGIAEAATGGRASGHWELAAPSLGIQAEQYSFVALSTAGFPNAKGQLQGSLTNAGGAEFDFHIVVDCLAITGNQAWASGVITKFLINGVPQPTGFDLQWRVQDNGEGANSPADLGSLIFFSSPQGCRFRPLLPMTPSANGNIQVSQK